MIITLFILMPAVCLFMLTNILAGCFLAVHFGYGPPDWKRGLNLLVRLTVLQKKYNALRKKIVEKYPASEKAFKLLRVPEKISLVPVVQVLKSEETTEADGSPSRKNADAPLEDPVSESELDTAAAGGTEREKPETEQMFFDKNLEETLMDKGTKAWLVNDSKIETALIKLNAVQMQSGRFTAQLDEKIRAGGSAVTKEKIVRFIEELKEDCKNFLSSQRSASAEIEKRIDEFGDLKPKVEEMRNISQQQRQTVESALQGLDGIAEASSPEVSAKMLLQELNGLRPARHKLRDMREQVFVRLASKGNQLGEVPKQLYADELSGLRGRIGLEVVLADWWKQKYNEDKKCSLALFDFVKFGDVNKKCGILLCDKIIRYFGETLKGQFTAADLTGVYSGNCFMAASHQLSLEKMTEKAEEIRQQFEKTSFRLPEREVSAALKMTAAVIEPSATLESSLSALESALGAAKRDGGSRLYVCVSGGEPVKAEVKDYHAETVEAVLE
ncbi:MAG: diguanylate cyclase [Planctomycetaceae bacterium]|jgi:diguanylate cyclase (GGDEF)-like protein|nr:diguanylate cyclase [Planctomycetaceae bacterium]